MQGKRALTPGPLAAGKLKLSAFARHQLSLLLLESLAIIISQQLADPNVAQ